MLTYVFQGTVAVVNTVTYEQLAVFTVNLTPFYEAISPDGSLLYVSTGEGLEKFSTTTYQLISELAEGVTGMSFSPDGSKIYTMNAFLGLVHVYNTGDDSLVAKIPVNIPYAIGSFVTRQAGCDGLPVKFTIEVDPSPPDTISVTGKLADLTTIYGTPSAADKIYVSGTSLQAGITATPPAGFEVSPNNIKFSGSVVEGTTIILAATPVYIRLAAKSPTGKYSGHIVLSSDGASDDSTELINGEVTQAPLIITADNKTKIYKDNNPVLTVTYKGFVNHENDQQLTMQPLIETTATVSSVVGKYPIIVSGAAALNYMITYMRAC